MIKRFLKYHPIHKKLVPNLDIVFLLRPTFFFSVWVMVVIGMSSAQMHLVDYPLWITEFSFMTFLIFLGLTFVCSSTFILNQIHDEENDDKNKNLFYQLHQMVLGKDHLLMSIEFQAEEVRVLRVFVLPLKMVK